MVDLLLRAGHKALRVPLPGPDAYASAIAQSEAISGYARHEITFDTFRDDAFVFSVSKDWTDPRLTPFRPAPLGDPKTWLLALARALGFPLAGITRPVLPARYTERFSQWLAKRGHGAMSYLERQRAKRLDPHQVLPGVRSVLAVATPYSNERHGPIARYAQGRDYHELLSARLDELKRAIYRELPGTRVYTSVDTGPVLERAYAEQAGLGWIGKNGMLISRTHGSYLSLATLWTTLDLEPDAPHAEYCGSCADCMSACPTQAITAPGWIEAERCISYWTIEHPGDVPLQAPDAHGWLFGCDACQEACPWSRFAPGPVIGALQPRADAFANASQWLSASDAELAERIAQTPLRRAGIEGIRRNARRLLPLIE